MEYSFVYGISPLYNVFKLFRLYALGEPNALKLEKEGLGYVVGSVGELSGEMPYTAFYARRSYINNNEDLINRFNNAINKGLDYVKNHNDEEIANVIIDQFPDSSLNDVIKIVKRYKDADTWLDNTTITQDSYENLEDIMIDNDLLDDYVDFNKLVINLNE